MKADDKSHLSTSNYVCLFECLFVFNFKNNLQLTFLVLPSSTLRYFPCQVKYLYSLNVFYCRHFLPISFQFSWFLHLSQAHSVMLTYTSWVCWDRKQSTGLGCLPNPSTAKNRTVISMGIVFPELVSQQSSIYSLNVKPQGAGYLII